MIDLMSLRYVIGMLNSACFGKIDIIHLINAVYLVIE